VSKLCTCWAIEAKVLKLAFSLSMTTNSYQELQELLEKECKILLEVSNQSLMLIDLNTLNLNTFRKNVNFRVFYI
ncbi:1789_t:CDS:1, partial [Cetraspora pellucida]